MSKTIWVTKDKVKVPISDMTDSHLENTIKYLRRNVERLRFKFMFEIGDYIAGAPDGAAMAAEQEGDYVAELDPEEFLFYYIEQYKALVAEARKRKIKI